MRLLWNLFSSFFLTRPTVYCRQPDWNFAQIQELYKMLTDTSKPKRKINRLFFVVLALVASFMYLSIIYKFAI
jgi:hypothetical protein